MDRRHSDGREQPASYDIAELLQFRGPILRLPELTEEAVSILDYRNTEENERNISKLLSSQNIPFAIERPTHGWSGSDLRMTVTVPRSLCFKAEAILSAGVAASALEIVEGMDGLRIR
jgi:hypothetical protein